MKLFGTDGIRGEAGTPPLEPDTVARVGAALVARWPGSARRARCACSSAATPASRGRGSRTRSPAGLTSEGAEVVSVGVVPTPAVAYLTKADGFDLGVVISASHNPYHDNGIKVFSGAGEKFTEAEERAVEAMVADPSWTGAAGGRPRRAAGADLAAHYLDASAPGAADGRPARPAPASSSTAPTAPRARWRPRCSRRWASRSDAIGVAPDGRNINLGCGSTAMEALQARVPAVGARLGVAFDGDGDRALFVDHTGRRVDGDAVMLICAEQLRRERPAAPAMPSSPR